MGRRYTIKDLPPELRPRERLLEAGPAALADGELLGLLFGIGNREKTAVELANEHLNGIGVEPIPEGLTPHGLRHTFASILAALGEPDAGGHPADGAHRSRPDAAGLRA